MFLSFLLLLSFSLVSPMRVYPVPNTQGLQFFSPDACFQWILPNPSCMCVPYENLDFPWIYQHQVPYMFLGSFRPDLKPMNELNWKLAQIYQNSLRVLDEKPKPQREIIPRIVHRFWVTDESDPHPLPRHLMNNLASSVLEMPRYVFYVWTSHPDLLEREMIIRDLKGRLVVKDIQELLDGMTKNVLEMIRDQLEARNFARASDVMRMFALYKYGGIYTDMDMLFSTSVDFLLGFNQTSFVIQGKSGGMLTEVYFMANPPNHPVYERLFWILENWQEMEADGGPMDLMKELDLAFNIKYFGAFTACMMEFALDAPIEATLFFWNSELSEFVKHTFDASWKSNKYGNKAKKISMFGQTTVHSSVYYKEALGNVTKVQMVREDYLPSINSF